MKHRLLAVLLCCAASAGVRADTDRDRLAAEHTAAEARLAEQERACNAQFVVSSCLEDARKAHRATLNRLRREELSLGDAARHAAAAARRKEIAEKAATQQTRASEADAADAGPAERIHPVPRPAPEPVLRSLPAGRPRPAGQPASGVSRAEQEQRNTEAFDARARSAEEHRQAVLRRNAEGAAKASSAPPLPVPAAASGSAAASAAR